MGDLAQVLTTQPLNTVLALSVAQLLLHPRA